MITISLESFRKLKSKEFVDITCDFCKCQFRKTKQQLYQNNRAVFTEIGFRHHNTCSKICQNNLQRKPPITKICECGNEFVTVTDSTFCSKSCASSHRTQTNTSKEKIRNSLKLYFTQNPPKRKTKIKKCSFCGKDFSKRKRRTCSDECRVLIRRSSGTKGGRISASKTIRRSKNETELCSLLSSKYECVSNTPMFNGWDADIIIPKLKLAILWNGVWHYSKVRKKHSVEQVQNRDWIKLNEILKCGYRFIVVKDYKNKMIPSKAFSIIEDCIGSDDTNLTII